MRQFTDFRSVARYYYAFANHAGCVSITVFRGTIKWIYNLNKRPLKKNQRRNTKRII